MRRKSSRMGYAINDFLGPRTAYAYNCKEAVLDA